MKHYRLKDKELQREMDEVSNGRFSEYLPAYMEVSEHCTFQIEINSESGYISFPMHYKTVVKKEDVEIVDEDEECSH